MPNTALGRTVAKNLKRILYEQKMSSAELARRLGIAKTTVSGWMNEYRVPGADTIDKICTILQVSRAELVEEYDPDKQQPYYLNEETAKIAQEVFDDPDLRLLFDASRDSRPEDIRMAAEMLRRFKETNPNG